MNDRLNNKPRIILQGSETTAFEYRIDGGMDERDKDEMEAMDSGYVLGRNWPAIVSESVDIHHRMQYARARNLGFCFLNVPHKDFEQELTDCDPALPCTLAYMVSDMYRNGTKRLSDLLENVERKNPANVKGAIENGFYKIILLKFLRSLTGSNDVDINLGDYSLDRIPADKFGCASIQGDKSKGYTTRLILQISAERRLKA